MAGGEEVAVGEEVAGGKEEAEVLHCRWYPFVVS